MITLCFTCFDKLSKIYAFILSRFIEMSKLKEINEIILLKRKNKK